MYKAKTNFAYIDKKRSILYVRIPKNATSTVVECYKKSTGFDFYEDESKTMIKLEEIKNYPTYFKFGFVRNPWDRLVSAYQNRVVEMFANSFGPNSGAQEYWRKVGIKRGIDFKRFVEIPALLFLITI